MALRVVRRPWNSQPQDAVGVDWKNPLSAGITHLISGVGYDAAALRPLLASGSIPSSSAEKGGVAQVSGASGGQYMPANTAQINAGNPWTIAALIQINDDASGVGALTSMSDVAGASTGSFDRSVIITYSAPYIYARGYVYDGTAKNITGSTPLIYSGLGGVVFSIVVSCGAGTLNLYVNGIEDATPIAVSNNGFTGYTTAFLNLFSDRGMTNWRVLQVAKTDNRKWGLQEAKLFHANPWQLFTPRRIWVPQSAAGPTLTALTPTTIGSTTHRPRYTWAA